MKITITPTRKVWELGDGHSARAWEGVTDSGAPCLVLVSAIAVEDDQGLVEEMKRELIDIFPHDRNVAVVEFFPGTERKAN